MKGKGKIQSRIREIETLMIAQDFWNDKDKAQTLIRELRGLKTEAEGGSKYDKGDAVITILSGAGGGDAEDFTSMLYHMYQKYKDRKEWTSYALHEHANDHSGEGNIAF